MSDETMENFQRSDQRAEVCRWRVGHKLGRTVYAMVGETASDDDELLGMMDTPELAALVVNAHNALHQIVGSAYGETTYPSGKTRTEVDAAPINAASKFLSYERRIGVD